MWIGVRCAGGGLPVRALAGMDVKGPCHRGHYGNKTVCVGLRMARRCCCKGETGDVITYSERPGARPTTLTETVL